MRNVLLLVLGIILTVLAIGFFQAEKEKTYASSEAPLLADFSLEKLNSLTKIVIHKENEKTELQRFPGRGWAVTELGGYPADTHKIRKLLQEILEAKTIEQKTDKREFYQELGVEDPQTPGAKNTFFGMYGDGQWQLIIGKLSRKMNDARYVRIYEQDDAWLVNQLLEVPEKALDWVDNQVLSLVSGDVREIKITQSNAPDPLLIQRERPRDNLSIVSLPADTPVNENALNELSYLVDPLNFLDVKSRESSPRDFPGDGLRAEYETFDGLVVTINAYRENSQPWFSISSTALSTADEKSQSEARTLDKKLQPWLYRVAGRAYDDLNKREEDFLQVKE